MSQLPKWKSHKTVHAVKIKKIVEHEHGTATIEPEHPDGSAMAPFEVSAAYVQRHAPQAGGYFVLYEDGYESWSPAKAFEDGYARFDDPVSLPSTNG